MVLGSLIAPNEAKAGLFSLITGSEAYADIDNNQIGNNSQTMPLLEAKTASVPNILAKDAKKDTKKPEEAIDPTKDINIVSDNALMASTGPLNKSGSLLDDTESSEVDLTTSVYVVRKGDSLAAIAKMYDVSVNTILWANDMKKGDKLKEGDVLFILPVSGLEHTVTKGQTIQSIAKLYKASVDEIIQYNDLAINAKLAVGDKIIVPNAEKSEESGKPIQNINASIAKDKQYYEKNPTKNLSGYYINPVPGYRKSQGIHDRNAVDLAIPTGTPIRAAASGKVTLARNGYNGGFGNLVIIKHPNGTETLYAHQSKISTTTGAEVSQGEIIGYVGSTGRSTGPHLHFEVHGARNPGADNSWAN